MKIILYIIAMVLFTSTSYSKPPLAAGPNGSVQYNSGGTLAGDANLTWTGAILDAGSATNGFMTSAGIGQPNYLPFVLFSNNRDSMVLRRDGSIQMGLVDSSSALTGNITVDIEGDSSIVNDMFEVSDANGGVQRFIVMGNEVFINTSNGLNMQSDPITHVTDPINPQDAATKNYVDSQSPAGTLCGWYDIGSSTLKAACATSNPHTSCPSGYTSTNLGSAWTCIKN